MSTLPGKILQTGYFSANCASLELFDILVQDVKNIFSIKLGSLEIFLHTVVSLASHAFPISDSLAGIVNVFLFLFFFMLIFLMLLCFYVFYVFLIFFYAFMQC